MSIMVHANGIRCLPEIRADYDGNKIVFAGNMRTLPNQDAVWHFVTAVFPAVRQRISNAVFYIIDAEPPHSVQKLADTENIVFGGFADSVEREIRDAAVAVVPVRIAAGIQNSVLAAMACGVPVVLTSPVSTDIPELVSNKNCFIIDDESDFANAVVSLMQDRNRRNSIGRAGYDMVKAEYSWNKRLDGYEELH